MTTSSRPELNHFSSEVSLILEVGEAAYDLSTVEPDCIVLKEQRLLETEHATLVISINNQTQRSPIVLTKTQGPTRNYHYQLR